MVCDVQEYTDCLEVFLGHGFWGRAQETVVRSFSLGTGAFALWMGTTGHEARAWHHDARIVVPLSWDTQGCGSAPSLPTPSTAAVPSTSSRCT